VPSVSPLATRRLRGPLLAILALGALLASACGGDDGEPAPLADPSDLKSYRYTLVGEMSGEPSGTGGASDGFALDLDVTLNASGSVVAPDREQSTLKADLGFIAIEVEQITIGDRSWTREPGGAWQEGGDSGFDLDVGSLSPASIFDESENGEGITRLREVLKEREGVREDLDGVEAVRYDLTADDLQALDDSGDLTSDIDELAGQLWLSRKEGYPLRLVMDGTGNDGETRVTVHMELNLTDINSSSIEVEAPTT
jgi:hypothetical protein